MIGLPPELLALDEQICSSAKQIRVLSTLRWPAGTRDRFVEGWSHGDPVLPDAPEPDPHDEQCQTLRELADRADALGGPAAELVAATARSYARAGDLLGAIGTDRFVDIGRELYGHPSEAIVPGGATHAQAAEHLLELTEGMPVSAPGARRMSSEEAGTWMRRAISEVFGEDAGPRVELDPGLDALATAGSRRVRLRGGARFAESQLRQLVEHEVRVHSATKLAGRAQPLGVLGLSSPRTTQTQEGLATLAELLTDTMDLRRLRRIALRVRAIHAACEGADLVQVAELFLEGGQSRAEAAASALRIFRGGRPSGGSFFLKDVVYLAGLMTVQTFLLKAFQHDRHHLTRVLFAGRMTLGDAIALEPLFDAGLLHDATVLPHWVAEPSSLAAQLALSAFHRRRDLAAVELGELEG